LSDFELSDSLEDLFETAPCGYVSLAPDGKIVRANRTLAGWLGWPHEELQSKSLSDLLALGGRIAFETHLAPLLRMQGYVNEIALELVRADGSKLPVIANAAERRDEHGRHLFTRFTLFKAVHRRSYERNLLERQVAAEAEANAQREETLLREQFIAVLGHDLRNPLGAVNAGLSMLSREQVSERGEVVLREMKKSVDRALSLIDNLLDLARGTLGGGFVLERKTDLSLAPALEQIVAEIRAIAPDHSIASHIVIDHPVSADRGRLAQLASNLLSNAVTHGRPDHPIRFTAETRGDLFILSVANAGEPIPPEAIDQLFQPFFRGEARPSRQGLGLGLYIASEIAKAHGGTLEVQSTDAETRFTFTMPRMG
jgi:sigma-B regulation protein RsbU (phosphoserine phosphatase)